MLSFLVVRERILRVGLLRPWPHITPRLRYLHKQNSRKALLSRILYETFPIAFGSFVPPLASSRVLSKYFIENSRRRRSHRESTPTEGCLLKIRKRVGNRKYACDKYATASKLYPPKNFGAFGRRKSFCRRMKAACVVKISGDAAGWKSVRTCLTGGLKHENLTWGESLWCCEIIVGFWRGDKGMYLLKNVLTFELYEVLQFLL